MLMDSRWGKKVARYSNSVGFSKKNKFKDPELRSSYIVVYTRHRNGIYILLGYSPEYNNLSIPGGGQMKNETPLDCAERELYEETKGILGERTEIKQKLMEAPFFTTTVNRQVKKNNHERILKNILITVYFLELDLPLELTAFSEIKLVGKKYNEYSELLFVTLTEFNKLIHSKGDEMYSERKNIFKNINVRSFLKFKNFS